jgi:probable phosphoglycerate mutase
MMKVILVRHGETDWNRRGWAQGLSDNEMNETGEKQAEAVALALKGEKVDAIYTSPLKRAVATAQSINRFHRVKIETIEGLKELDIGKLDGLRVQEMKSLYPSFWCEWSGKHAAAAKCPEGESLSQLQNRGWAAIQGIIERHRQGTVVVVSHYFVLTSIICKAIQLDLSYYLRFRPMDATAVNIIEFSENGTTLTLFNDTCHLRRMLSM